MSFFLPNLDMGTPVEIQKNKLDPILPKSA